LLTPSNTPSSRSSGSLKSFRWTTRGSRLGTLTLSYVCSYFADSN
jgi:hypothetical protein